MFERENGMKTIVEIFDEWRENEIRKFTKGPWSACNDGKCDCNQISGNGCHIAKVTMGEWGDDYPSIRLIGGALDRKAEAYMERIPCGYIDKEEAKANLHLIAAAPDLYEACKAIVAARKNIQIDEAFCMAKKAIERAENG